MNKILENNHNIIRNNQIKFREIKIIKDQIYDILNRFTRIIPVIWKESNLDK